MATDNSLFSSLVYRIIGEPDKWQHDAVERINQLLDQSHSLDNEENFHEIELGNQIIQRISGHDEVLTAFETFLEETVYGLVIVDEDFNLIFNNSRASKVVHDLLCDSNNKLLKASLVNGITQSLAEQKDSALSNISKLDYSSPKVSNIYLRSSLSDRVEESENKQYYTLLITDDSQQKTNINAELKTHYELSNREESIILALLEGKSITEIADESFRSQETIRSQLKSIFAKTETNSQTALVRLFLNHELQQLDSYFKFKIPSTTANLSENKDKFVTLSNDKKICYRDYGPASGMPIVVLHNNYSSRLNVPHDCDDACIKHNRRIIIPDRPGYGKSDWVEDYPKNWNQQLNEFIDILGLQEFDLIANSSVAQLAIEYSAQPNNRLNKVILTSPVFISDYEHAQYLGDVLTTATRLIKTSHTVAMNLYKLWLKSMSINMKKHLIDNMTEYVASNEQHLFMIPPKNKYGLDLACNEDHLIANDKFIQIIINNFQEATSQAGIGGAHDLVHNLTPSKIDLSKITTPIELWIGDEDDLVTVEGVKAMAEKLPNKTIYVKRGYGKHIYYSLFDEIIAYRM